MVLVSVCLISAPVHEEVDKALATGISFSQEMLNRAGLHYVCRQTFLKPLHRCLLATSCINKTTEGQFIQNKDGPFLGVEVCRDVTKRSAAQVPDEPELSVV